MHKAPRLLVTRLAPHAQYLVEQLNQSKIYAIAEPLLEVAIVPVSPVLNQFVDCDFDIVIAVSGNAVKYTQQYIDSAWPIARYFAIGESTQLALQNATQQIVAMPMENFDSEGLLALDELQDVDGKNILILRGEGGRNLLHETLQKRGAIIHFLETYKRVAVDLDGVKCVNTWQQAQINGAIISSVEILNQLVKLIPLDRMDWLKALDLYVPSQRVADYAQRLGINNVYLLPSLQTKQVVSFFSSISDSK